MAENLTPKKYIDDSNMKQILAAVKNEIPTTVAELSDSSDYAKVTDVQKKLDKTFTGADVANKILSTDENGNVVLKNGGSGEENKIDSISINGSPITPDENKNVDITVPTVTNDLTNELKASYDSAVSATHTHGNKDTLDKISASSDGRLLYNGNNMPVVIPTSQPSVLLAGSIWIEAT